MDRLLEILMRPRRAWAVAVLALLAGVLAIGWLGEAERDARATDQLPRDKDSTTVVELLDRFPQGDDATAIVLFTADDGLAPGDLAQLQERFTAVSTDLGASAESPAGPPGGDPTATLVPSEDGTAALGVLAVPATAASEVADLVSDLRDDLRADLPEGVEAQVTGPAAIQADLAAVFDGANFRLLAATASVVAVLLIVTYRSPILWLIPLFVVGIADRAAVSLATHTLAATGVAWDESTVGILSVLVFGAGTDYALLLISRYRDELRLQEDRYVAMRRALHRTGEAVLASSTTVVVGVLTLMLSLIPSTRGLGLACAVGIVVAALAALVALPFFLVLFGRWVFWPRTPRVGQATLTQSRTIWSRIGSVVRRRPTALATVTIVVLAGFAAGMFRIETGLSEADQFLETPEAIAAAERLAESYPAGSADPSIVITPEQDADRVAGIAADVEGVSSVRPVATADGLARLDVVVEAEPASDEARATVERLREALADVDATYVGGTEAESIDEGSATSRDRFLLIPLILALVTGALMLLLRSLVAPLILVASVVLTYLASLGVSWFLFTNVFGFERLDSGVPLLAFLFLVALGVDYNIFLVTRAAEEAKTHGPQEGMLRALTATGGVITSAGILLAAVFAVLGVLPLVVLAQLGVVICVGVLLDTLVVRTVVVPAIAVRMGHAFWWPRRLGEHEVVSGPGSDGLNHDIRTIAKGEAAGAP